MKSAYVDLFDYGHKNSHNTATHSLSPAHRSFVVVVICEKTLTFEGLKDLQIRIKVYHSQFLCMLESSVHTSSREENEKETKFMAFGRR